MNSVTDEISVETIVETDELLRKAVRNLFPVTEN
jgi:hypothetical protein